MAILCGSFSFFAGTVAGVYIAQNYNFPNIKKVVDSALFTAKLVEQKYRKPNKPGDGDTV